MFAVGGCGSDSDEPGGGALPQGAERVRLESSSFTTDIDNPYFPLAPGSRWIYDEGRQRVVVTATDRTKEVNGITARVVTDVVTEHGKLVESTRDWYAQDADGDVWYMGEATTEYENGKPKTTEGSWEAGVDGAQPGIIMPAQPSPGQAYRQEYYKGHAEDRAKVITLDARVEVPYGKFDDALETEDTAPLGNAGVEHKYYARDVGLVLARSAGGEREELVSFRRGR
jgi:hypothetical protein